MQIIASCEIGNNPLFNVEIPAASAVCTWMTAFISGLASWIAEWRVNPSISIYFNHNNLYCSFTQKLPALLIP